MLIILNGAAATQKRLIANKIFHRLNNLDNYKIDDYYGDLTNYIKIYDKNRKIVYEPSNEMGKTGVIDLLQTDSGELLISKFLKVMEEMTNVTFNANNGSDDYWKFVDKGVLSDLGRISPTLNNEEINYCCNDMIKTYGETKFEHVVFTGYSYSKTVIEELKNKLKDDLHVINLTRNPSVVFMMNTGHPPCHEDDGCDIPNCNRNNITKMDNETNDTDLDFSKFSTFKYLDEECFTSILCSSLLSKVDYVQQEKFEDYMRTGKIMIKDMEILLPEPLKPYNKYLTKYERVETLKKIKHVLMEKTVELKTANHLFSNLQEYIITDNKENIINNFFETLKYQPLSFEEMIKL